MLYSLSLHLNFKMLQMVDAVWSKSSLSQSMSPVLALRQWAIVYAAVSIPFKDFTRHWGLRDCTTLISFVSELGKGSTLNTDCTNKPCGKKWRLELSETLHLPQLFSTNMAVCATLASQIQGTFPCFKGFPGVFFHLCAPAHGQKHELIFQNMFLACKPPPLSSAPLPLSHMQPVPCSPLTPLSSPHPQLACSSKYVKYFPYLVLCCSTALSSPITRAVCFMD